MIEKLLRAGFVLALAALVMPAAASAQADWNKTVDAARKEGKVIVGGPPSPRLRNLLKQAWAKDFPGIDMTMAVAAPRGFAGKLKLERKAGKYLWDGYISVSSSAMFRVAKEVFDPLPPALILDEVTDPKAWIDGFAAGFNDKGGDRIFAFLNFLSAPWYNAKVIPPERIAKDGLKVMLDPAFKGKIAIDDPRKMSNGARNLTLIRMVLGDKAMKTILVDQQPVFYRSLNDVAEAMARGKAVIAIGANLDFRMDRYKKAGLDVDMRPFGNTAKTAAASSGPATLAIFNRAPHPNAARVFVNWILTKKMQTAITKRFRWNSRRKDVPIATGPARAALPGVKYIYLQKEEAAGLTGKTIGMARKLRPPK